MNLRAFTGAIIINSVKTFSHHKLSVDLLRTLEIVV